MLPFQRESVCKGKAFFCNLQIFSKVFFEKIFGRFSEGVRLILSRSLAHPQGKIFLKKFSEGSQKACGLSFLAPLHIRKVRYSVQQSALSPVAPASLSLSSSAALPLESGCKGTDFFLSCNFYRTLFCKVFSGSCLTR